MSSTQLFAWGPGTVTWTIPAGMYRLDYVDVFGAGGSGALKVYNATCASGGGGGAFVRSGAINVTPGQVLTIRVGAGGAGQQLAGQGATANGLAGGATQVDGICAAEGGFGGIINGTAASGGRAAASWGGTAYDGGRSGTAVGPYSTNSGGGGGAGPYGPGGAGADITGSSIGAAGASAGGRGGNGQGGAGSAGATQVLNSGNGANGAEYGPWGSGGGSGGVYYSAGNPQAGAGGHYGGGSGSCYQTAAAYVARTSAGGGGLCVIQGRYYSAVTVSGCSPNNGSTNGGTYLTITGSGFEGVSNVTVGGANATGITVHNDSTITCYAPAHAAGACNVSVFVNTGVPQGNGINLYTYYAPPAVTGCDPPLGSINGATPVTISGSLFTGVSSVTFGGAAATSVNVVNANTITCITPAHALGLVAVNVNGTYGTGSANVFTYVLPAGGFNMPMV